jgi:CxxC-x17-CxxC domain-containing protein
MAFQDKSLTCADCGATFTFTASEQEFYAEKGFTNEPKRCQPCRQSRKAERGGGTGGGFGGRRGPRQMFPATCAQCGKQTEVPFEPRGDKPVYCSDCFSKMRG